MKIRALRLKQFKKFDRPVLVQGFGDGLNVIAGPNETGKSTLLLALRAALFEYHKATTKTVKNLPPHHVEGAAPEVALDFEIGGKRYHLEKRFLRRPMARLETEDGRRFEDREAEAEVKRLLGLNTSEKTPIDKDSPGHFGVMLTPQTRSFTQPTLVDTTRHSLEASITSEIDDLGSQSDVEALLADIRQDRSVFIDGRDKPKGRYKDILTRLEALDRKIEDLKQKRDLLHQDVDALNQAVAVLDKLSSSESGKALADHLTLLEAQRAHAVRMQDLDNRRLAASHRLQQLQTKRDAIRGRLEERNQLSEEAVEIERQQEAAGEALKTVERSLSEREKIFASLREKEEELTRRRRRLETLAQQIERRRDIGNTLNVLATDVRFDLEDNALDRLTINGNPPEHTRSTIQVTEGLNLAIEGIGRIAIQPKTEPMRDALNARDEVEATISDILRELNLGETESEAIDDLFRELTGDIETIRTQRADLETSLANDRRHAADARASVDAQIGRSKRLEERLTSLTPGDGNDSADDLETLASEIGKARAAVEAAKNDIAVAAGTGSGDDAPGALPLDQLDAEIKCLAARIEERRQRMVEATKTIVRLESAISVRAGLGLDEQIDQLDRQHQLLAEERGAFALDHDALSLLEATLTEATEEAKATFNAPLSARLAPYIQDLFPDATPLVTPNFSIRAIDRNGVEEPFLHLSDGTREQIAILARLAFADMLKEQGLPALVVLDDALAFSDSERLARMFTILEKAATHMQIIILTCREDRLADLKATRLQIAPAPEQTSSAA